MFDTAPFWMRLAAGLGAGAASSCAAMGLGGLARLSIFGAASRLVGFALQGAVGYALLGSAVAILGVFHAITPASLGALIVLGLVALALQWRRNESAPRASDPAAAMGRLDRFAWAVSGFAWLTAAVAAALPTVDWDPLAYHLPIAADALRSGYIAFDPGIAQSAFPLLAESASLPAYWLGGTAGAAFSVLFAGGLLALISGRIAERVRQGSGPLVCALVSSSAVWLWLAPAPYVDVPYAMFAVAALGIALCAQPIDRKSAIAAGLFAGACAAVKYPGLGVIGIVLAVIALRVDAARRFGILAIALAAAIIVCAGWYLRAWTFAGDPLYPFLTARFGATEAVRDFASRYVAMTRDWCGSPATVTDFLLLPWRLLTQPQLFCGDPGYALRLASVLVVAAFFVRSGRPIAAITAALTTIWFWTSRQWRFLVPAVATYAIAAAAGLDAVAARQRKPITALLLCVAFAGVGLDWLPKAGGDASNSIAPAFAYVAGGVSGTDYLSARLEFYAADTWAIAHLRGGERIAALDDVRNYYLGAAAIGCNPYYQQRCEIDWSAAPAHRYDRLRELDAALLIVNENAAFVNRTPTGVDWAVLGADERAGVLVRAFAANDVIVYAFPRARAASL
jgi:hypothetical protein